MTIKIRETTNLKEWRAVYDRVMGEDLWASSECEFYWVATLDGKIAGFSSMALLKETPGWAFFTSAGVLTKYRGNGIHQRMISVRIRCARKLRLSGIITYAHTSNFASINHLYRRGFSMYEPKHNWLEDWKGEFQYFMLKF